MINIGDIARGNIKERNWNWPKISDHSYKILIIRGSGSRKTHALLNLIGYQPNINKVYLYDEGPFKEKHQLLLFYQKRKLQWSSSFYCKLEWYGWYLWKYGRIQSDKEHKMLIVFDDMVADIFINKKLQQIVEEVFIISKKLNFSLDFIA